MKKILFLDHDGVICLHKDWGSRFKKQEEWGGRKLSMSLREIPVKYRFDNFDKESIDVLNEIIQETDCDIIVSSDWRFHGTLEELQELYRDNGIKKVPIGTTKLDFLKGSSMWPERNRAGEILEWVQQNLTEEDRWVAVDDLPLGTYIEGIFVRAPFATEGIKQTGIKERVISILNK